eukprot:TRINITY_DN14578_c0_g2_i1.p1 TRINITY_DN14578_c0_g2~~TRINITY_DN14578_c0_g2_i1.p1  ORF type:complete len:155 (-),score=0.66 TRINITY_DN14578_c0_g2_i1:246-710(-)
MPSVFYVRKCLPLAALAGLVCFAGVTSGYRLRESGDLDVAEQVTSNRNNTSTAEAVDHGDDLDCYDLAGEKNISNYIGRSCWSNYGVNAGCGCFLGCQCKVFEECAATSWSRELNPYAQKVGHCGWASWLRYTIGIVIAISMVGLFVFVARLIF